MQLGLKVEDRRGDNNSLALRLVDGGFELAHYGNEVIDASELKRNGTISVNKHHCKLVNEDSWGYHFKVIDY